MRLLTKAYYYQQLEMANSFEGITLAEADADPDDGWYIGGSGTQAWANWSESPTVSARTGSQAMVLGTAAEVNNLYRTITTGKSFVVEGWTYWDTAGPTNVRWFAMQLDEGADTDNILSFGTPFPSTAIALTAELIVDAGASDYIDIRLLSRFTSSPATYTLEKLITKTSWVQDKWIGLKLQVTTTGYIIYSDYGDTGTWTVEAQGSWTNTATMEDLTKIRVGADGNAAAGEEVLIEDIAVYNLITTAADEITSVTKLSCTKSLGGGVVNVTLRDFELANYSTIKDHIWISAEVLTNDLSRTLWEGFLTRPVFRMNHVNINGISGLKALDKIPANYSAVLAAGEVTAVGADYIDDSTAAFTDDSLTKLCTFTDAAGPDDETVYPNASSDIYESDRTTGWDPTSTSGGTETGGYGSLATSEDYWQIEGDKDDFCCILEFTVPNAASCAVWELSIFASFAPVVNYTTMPSIYLWNQNATAWQEWLHDGDTKISWAGDRGPATYTFTNADMTDTDEDHYFNGTTFKVAFHAGIYVWGAYTKELLTLFTASLKNTYSTAFTAQETIYTVDGRTATRLTFTGQTPQADGIGPADRYKVGDYLHNNMNEIWDAASLVWIGLDYDDSTSVDATDYQSAYVGDVLRRYARLDDREVWQAIGWNIMIKSSYEDTGIDLTEDHIVTNPLFEGWTYDRDGSNIIKDVKVFGGGISYADNQIPDYASPGGLIHTDNRIATQKSALDMATSLLAEHNSSKDFLRLTIDCDSGITNIANLDVGKTIDVNLYSGTITISAGLIREVAYNQHRGGPLYASLVIEVL